MQLTDAQKRLIDDWSSKMVKAMNEAILPAVPEASDNPLGSLAIYIAACKFVTLIAAELGVTEDGLRKGVSAYMKTAIAAMAAVPGGTDAAPSPEVKLAEAIMISKAAKGGGKGDMN